MTGNYVTLKVKQESLGRVLRDIRNWEGGKKLALQREVVARTLEIETGAKQAAPVAGPGKHGGYLRVSIHSGFSFDLLGGRVWAAAPYAPYQEFGTGDLVDVPPGFEEFALQFKGRGIRKVNIRAKHFIYNAWQRAAQKFIDNVERILRS